MLFPALQLGHDLCGGDAGEGCAIWRSLRLGILGLARLSVARRAIWRNIPANRRLTNPDHLSDGPVARLRRGRGRGEFVEGGGLQIQHRVGFAEPFCDLHEAPR